MRGQSETPPTLSRPSQQHNITPLSSSRPAFDETAGTSRQGYQFSEGKQLIFKATLMSVSRTSVAGPQQHYASGRYTFNASVPLRGTTNVTPLDTSRDLCRAWHMADTLPAPPASQREDRGSTFLASGRDCNVSDI
ncbi:hypothetical protein NDU88_000470 [Pleurodeles waltl]|uniref:Uncharacterized protein n=1 Tax=Pleurodeles waltl TaxID=8319 RepID=A0AAV7LIN8_PLEWA|nr:hypothetical protein NDU88_000470 [Pleurodeles waltl]